MLWLPFGLIESTWPDAVFSSALVGVILAYVAGHVLQTVATNAIPSNFLGGRFPSSVFLDATNRTFSNEFKIRLARQINRAFDLDVYGGASIEDVRRDAFFLCRSALIKSKTGTYAEQFEGLYALMRGLSAAFGISVVYYLGWACSGLLQPIKTFRFVAPSLWSWPLSGLVILVGLLIAVFALINANLKRAKTIMIGSLLLAAVATGYYLGLSSVGASAHRGHLIAAAVLSFFASERCYAGYRTFAQEFAKTVYRDFSNYEKPVEGHGANLNPDPEAEA
jgi:hypothetical protein